LLFFLFLQGFSIYLIVSYSKYHEAVFSKTSNELSGNINTKFHSLEQYFYLQRTNDSLVKMNQLLYNQLKAEFGREDSSHKIFIDTIKIDSFKQYRKYQYQFATVVSNSVAAQNNYIVIDKGSSNNIRIGMGVVSTNNSVVGIVTEVSENYAVVMSILHKDSHISGKLSRKGEVGTVSWNGVDPNYIILNNIPKSSKIYRGDSVISSGFSTAFPKGIMIGRVDAFYLDKSSNYSKIKCKTSTDFYNIQYVYILKNVDQDGVAEVLDKVKKQR